MTTTTNKYISEDEYQEIKNKKGANANRDRAAKTRSQSNAEASQNLLKTKVSKARFAIRKSVKAEIIIGGISDALNDIASGNFDDVELTAIEALEGFTSGFLDNHQDILDAEISDVPLLNPSSDQKEFPGEDVQSLEKTFHNSPTTNENTEKKSDFTNTKSSHSSSHQKKGKN